MHILDGDAQDFFDEPSVDVFEVVDAPDEDIPESVDALDEVVPTAPTTPDLPTEQHPSPPTMDDSDSGSDDGLAFAVNLEIPLTPWIVAEVDRLVYEIWGDSLRQLQRLEVIEIYGPEDEHSPHVIPFNRAAFRTVGKYRCQTCHCWTGRTRTTYNKRNIWVSDTSCYYCTWTASWSLATDKSLDLEQTLANAQDHVQSGREKLQNEEDEIQANAEFLRKRMLATQDNTKRRMGDIQLPGWTMSDHGVS